MPARAVPDEGRAQVGLARTRTHIDTDRRARAHTHTHTTHTHTHTHTHTTHRLRLSCLEEGRCNPKSAGMRSYDRLLAKVPEHTWGVAQAWFLPDYTNWTNVDFDKARAQQADGFVYNNTVSTFSVRKIVVEQSAALEVTVEQSSFADSNNLTFALIDSFNFLCFTRTSTHCSTPSSFIVPWPLPPWR